MNKFSKLLSFYSKIVKNRNVIWGLALNDFKARFVTSFLGVFWAFVTPLCTLLVMWYAFAVGLKAGDVGESGIPFILWLSPAYLMWAYFTEVITSTTNCLKEYSYLVKKVNFDVGIIPIVKIISCSFVHIAFIGIMLILNACYGYKPCIYNLQIIYYLFCLLVLEIGLGMLVSSVTLFIPDVGSIVSIVLQIGFWVTPIIWNVDSFKDSQIVQIITKLNPMFYICRGYRDSMINNVWLWQYKYIHLYFWGVTILILTVGTYVFHRLRPQFADLL